MQPRPLLPRTVGALFEEITAALSFHPAVFVETAAAGLKCALPWNVRPIGGHRPVLARTLQWGSSLLPSSFL